MPKKSSLMELGGVKAMGVQLEEEYSSVDDSHGTIIPGAFFERLSLSLQETFDGGHGEASFPIYLFS
ncbi:hypothetical protein Syun_016680 [Stephania yunnanensis]|uniref:Uncharacterized protein n=1 Tax=Stephania yunnanensis TaxID=152371 RepID=A0AAP0P2E2_9MAGN